MKLPGPPAPPRCAVPIGQTVYGALELDLDRVLAGRMLVQGGSGAGKSQTMRRIVEEAFDYVQTMIVDPEGEFGNLAAHIGATTLKAAEIAADGLTAAATRARHHRIALHLDLTDLDPEQRIIKASAFFAVIAHGVGRKVLRGMRMPDSPCACHRPRFMS